MDTATVSQFIEKEGLTSQATKVPGGCPWNEKWKCDAWKVEIKHPSGRVVTFDYYTGIGHRTLLKGVRPSSVYRELNARYKANAPSLDSVLDSLHSDGAAINETFEDWCANFGYEEDSRKAEKTYNACRHNALRLKKFLGGEAFDRLLQTESL